MSRSSNVEWLFVVDLRWHEAGSRQNRFHSLVCCSGSKDDARQASASTEVEDCLRQLARNPGPSKRGADVDAMEVPVRLFGDEVVALADICPSDNAVRGVGDNTR